MAAATTIAILIMLTVVIVRIAGVIMRLTGLPESIARFQALSALTGTGFTTGESEMIVNYPIRRHVLMALMIIGHLGLVTLASTFIIALTNAHTDGNSLFLQAMIIFFAIVFVLILTLFKPLDTLMCGYAEKILRKTTKLGAENSRPVLQLSDGYSIEEYTIDTDGKFDLNANSNDVEGLTYLGIRRAPDYKFVPYLEDIKLKNTDIIICFGSRRDHEYLKSMMVLK